MLTFQIRLEKTKGVQPPSPLPQTIDLHAIPPIGQELLFQIDGQEQIFKIQAVLLFPVLADRPAGRIVLEDPTRRSGASMRSGMMR